jgi:hypothetical protein
LPLFLNGITRNINEKKCFANRTSPARKCISYSLVISQTGAWRDDVRTYMTQNVAEWNMVKLPLRLIS